MKCPYCGKAIKEITDEEKLKTFIPKRYSGKEDIILKIAGIYKYKGNKFVVEELKKVGVIAPSTYWADVSFVSCLLDNWIDKEQE